MKIRGRIFFYEEIFSEGNRLGLNGNRITCSFSPPLPEEIAAGKPFYVAKGFEIKYIGSINLDQELLEDNFSAQFGRSPEKYG